LIGGALGIVVGGILGFFGGGRIAKFMDSIGTFVSETYENMVQGIKDFFFDREIVGGAGESYTQRSGMGKIKDQMMENFENNMKAIKDFFFDDKGNLFGINFGGLKDLLPTLREIADKIVSSLPKWMRPDTIGEKIFETQQKIQFEKDQIASGDMRDGFLNKRTDNIKELESELSDLEASLPEGYKVDIKKMDTTSGSSIESGTTLKSVAEIRSTTGAPSNITIMKGGDTKADKTQVFQGDNIHFSKRINGLGTADAVLDQIK